MTAKPNFGYVVGRLQSTEPQQGILALLSQAAQAASEPSESYDRVFDLVQQCMSKAGRTPLLAPIYDAILCAALKNRDIEREIERKSEELAFVYFIRRADGLIKIGYSYAPEKRLAQVRSHCGQEVEILATTQGAKKLEKSLHRRFADQRIEGEWFTASAELLLEIARYQ